MTVDDQHRVLLTPHPLQRAGAYALAQLAGVRFPEEVTPDGFRSATTRMTRDAVHAALVLDSKQPEGFWLKSSRSFFPNSKMNHPSNARKDGERIKAEVVDWRTPPDPMQWPLVACVLCGRAAVGFFGKVDVPLVESEIYRNTTPRGHEGTALCWPCVCSFYALPYACQLTGGPSIVLHSWDDEFLGRTVRRQVDRNGRVLATGRNTARQLPAREVVALRALREYEGRVRAGVELLVFSNDNRGQSLDSYSVEQPLAEWLRGRSRGHAFGALLRAHRTDKTLGQVGLMRNAFREPQRIVGACARYLLTDKGAVRPVAPELAELTYSYVNEVMKMDVKDLEEVRAIARRIAAVLSAAKTGGQLNAFYAQFRDQRKLRAWVQRQGVYWALRPPDGESGPLVTTRGFELLFDPGIDSQAWFNRQLLMVAVLESLHEKGWRPVDADQAIEELAEDPDQLDEDERLTLEEGEAE